LAKAEWMRGLAKYLRRSPRSAQGIRPNLFYRWKDEAEQGAKAALGGRSAAAAETEKDHRIRQLERTLGRKALEIEILKNVVGE
jgi:transposase-like protein